MEKQAPKQAADEGISKEIYRDCINTLCSHIEDPVLLKRIYGIVQRYWRREV